MIKHILKSSLTNTNTYIQTCSSCIIYRVQWGNISISLYKNIHDENNDADDDEDDVFGLVFSDVDVKNKKRKENNISAFVSLNFDKVFVATRTHIARQPERQTYIQHDACAPCSRLRWWVLHALHPFAATATACNIKWRHMPRTVSHLHPWTCPVLHKWLPPMQVCVLQIQI